MMNVAKRTNRAGEETRAAIIQAAIAVLIDHGLAGLTLQDVAGRAGIRYGNLTHHYASRRDLIEAIMDAVGQGYVARFESFAASLTGGASDIEALLIWLLDDAVTAETAGIFLELWASARRDDDVADRVHRLYDQAVEACIIALGASPEASGTQPLREALYLLGTIVEGSSCLFASRDRDCAAYRGFRRDAMAVMLPLLDARLRLALGAT